MTKNKQIELNDDYFINLTMKYDERDDEIYPKWSLWCAQSNYKYYIDGKNGYFYTHIRTEYEIKVEIKKDEVEEMLRTQDRSNISDEDWRKYEEYLRSRLEDEYVLSFHVPTYIEWISFKEESGE